jgi:hypothetical protein
MRQGGALWWVDTDIAYLPDVVVSLLTRPPYRRF